MNEEHQASGPQAAVNAVVALLRDGQLDPALERASELAAAHPREPVLHNVLGVILGRLGRLIEALASYDRALELRPEFPDALNNRGNALSRLGRHEEAIASFRRVLEIQPRDAEALNSMGSALHGAGRIDEAVGAYREALTIVPGHAGAQVNLGNALADLDQPQEALACYEAALQSDPALAPAHYNQGKVLASLGHNQTAAASFDRALRLRPDYAEACNGLGAALLALGHYRQAAAVLARAVQLRPGFAAAHSNLGNALCDLGRSEEAIMHIREALRVEPGFVRAYCNLGVALCDLGRYEDAASSYRQALEINPEMAAVHNNLSQIHDYSAGDPHIEQMQALLDSGGLSEGDAMHLNFALGKACDDLGEFDRAFAHFSAANRLQRNTLGYRIDGDRQRFEWIRSMFEGEALPLADQAGSEQPGGREPLLIVGMPRSGTTLVEQILASHSEVYGGGERETAGLLLTPLLDRCIEQGQRLVTLDVVEALRREYLADLAALPGTERIVTDKMPGNFRWLGFMFMAIRDLKVIHVRRDPMATCWSLFRHYFAGGGHGYACDQVEVASYYRLYEELMAFWHSRFPGRIHDLDYERLTEEQESESRRLLAFCGLDWEQDCLDFHLTRRSVRTLSGQQVRRGIYTGSSRAWRDYEPHLGPMLEVLGHS